MYIYSQMLCIFLAFFECIYMLCFLNVYIHYNKKSQENTQHLAIHIVYEHYVHLYECCRGDLCVGVSFPSGYQPHPPCMDETVG